MRKNAEMEVTMEKLYRMTKKDAQDLSEILQVLGIESKIECEGKSNWLIRFDFDEAEMKKRLEQKQMVPKTSPTGEKLRAQVKKYGIAKICLKYGISERTVYRRMKQNEKEIKND